MFLTIVIFLLVLSLLVLVHELGHFLTARRCGVRAEEFGLGFPPRALGFYKSRSGHWRFVFGDKSIEKLENLENEKMRPAAQSTVYSLNWLPLGGFVKIKGENGEGRDEKDSFSSKSIWRRALILSAGVIMNMVLAWFLFSVGYIFGLPQSTDSLGANAKISNIEVIVMQVLNESPAAVAGLKEGDAILRINNVELRSEKNLQDAVAQNANQETDLVIKRDNQELKVKVTPLSKDGEKATIGVAIYSSGLVSYPFFSAFWEGIKTTGWVTGQIFIAFYDLIKQIFAGQNVSGQFAGPVGIAGITGQAARLGFTYLLQFMALLSINLAVINILPLPALDGGRILFLIIEKFKGAPVKREIENIIHNVGFILLIALVIFITYKDVIKLF